MNFRLTSMISFLLPAAKLLSLSFVILESIIMILLPQQNLLQKKHLWNYLFVLILSKFITTLAESSINSFRYSCPKKACDPATEFLASATGNDWFRHLKTTDGSNLLMNAYRQRKRRHDQTQSPTTPKQKRKPAVVAPPPEDLDAAVAAFSRCVSAKETENLAAATV